MPQTVESERCTEQEMPAAGPRCKGCRGPAEQGWCTVCGAYVAPQPGELIDGKWKLLERLGRGSMGSVFTALDVALDRIVAVKFLGAGGAGLDEAHRARFSAEARALGRLDHPNVVSVFAFGEHGPTPFLVMRYTRGKSLETLLAEHHRFEPADLLPLLAQLGEGLDALHAVDLVHRDLKPQNLLVGEDGRLVIIDLGIVRDQQGRSGTQTGMTIGTPRYMSPEQVRGDRHIGPESDVYALGLIAFECLTGAQVFDSANPFALMKAHLEKTPRAPSELCPHLPEAVDAVVLNALAKDPAERPASGAAFFAALCEALAEPVLEGQLLDEDEPLAAPEPLPTLEVLPAPLRPASRAHGGWRWAAYAAALVLAALNGHLP